MGSLVLSSLRWATIARVFQIVLQFIGLIIFSRLLNSSDFGLITLASTVTGFASLFRDFGSGAAIIQQKIKDDDTLSTIFWINILLGLLLSGILMSLTPLISFFFNSPQLNSVLLMLLLNFPIWSLGAVQQAMLERACEFNKLAFIEIFSSTLGLISGVTVALNGGGIYGLVTQALLTSLANSICLWLFSTWRPSKRFKFNLLKKKFLDFGGYLTGFNIVLFSIRNADNLIISRYLGPSDLGFYSLAYRLMLWPLQNISAVMGRVMFPTFSELNDNDQKLSSMFIKSTGIIVFVSAPLMLGFYVLRDLFVEVTLGGEWMQVAAILAWLIPVGFIHSILTSTGNLYISTGRTKLFLLWGIVSGLVFIPAFIIGASWGIEGVAASFCISSFILFVPGLLIPMNFINLKIISLWKEIAPAIVISIFMALALSLILNLIKDLNISSKLMLMGLVFLGVIFYIILSYIFQRLKLKIFIQFLFPKNH